ncbi:sushi, von Willebrand factor type A, EGF and pentraxin domain-containing protein 1-like isoform X6 [Amblyomma americanum]
MRAVLDAEVRVMKPEPETKVFAGLLILLTSLLCGKQAVIACSTAEVGIVGDDDFDIYEKLCYYSRHGNSCTCRPGYIINGTRCRDVEEPMATFCPDDIVVYHKTPTVNVSWEEPTFVDNGPGEVKVVADTEPGSAFIWGPPTTVTYRATDAAGNTAICSFKVVVRRPVAVFCPDDIVIRHGSRTLKVTWKEPTLVLTRALTLPHQRMGALHAT